MQQGHIDEEVPCGEDHILAHLPSRLLVVQLPREAVHGEHRGSAYPTSRLPPATLCSLSGSLVPPLLSFSFSLKVYISLLSTSVMYQYSRTLKCLKLLTGKITVFPFS